MNIFSNQDNSKKNSFETWPKQEQKEQFDKNLEEFSNKYKESLEKILPEDLVKKISGSFELSWNIDSSLDKLKENWLSEESLEKIKSALKENKELSEADLKNISEEIEKNKDIKDFDLKLGDLIIKANKIAENTENDSIFELAQKARKIQKDWSLEEKKEILAELENTLNWENSSKLEESKIQKPEAQKEISTSKQQSFWVEEASVWNDKWILEDWFITWDIFSRDKQPESNDYWNVQIEKRNNFFQKWVDFLKWDNLDWQKIEWEKIFFKNSEFSPILENLKSVWEISEENFSKINEDLSWKSTQQQRDIFINFIEKLPNSENKTNVLKNFDNNKEEITEKNFEKTDFSIDTKWVFDLDKSIWGLECMLAENYIHIWKKENWQEKNKEENINTSMEVTKSKIIKSKSNDFKNNNAELIEEISKTTNLAEKYKLLKELYKESLKEDAKAWWKKWKEEMERKKEDLISKYKEVLEKIKESEKSGNKAELNNLMKQKKQIELEARETQNTIEELDKVAKETDLDIWVKLSEKKD